MLTLDHEPSDRDHLIRQLKDLVSEMNSARMAFHGAQWQLAHEIVGNYRDLLELIDAGVVKPCIPMSMIRDAMKRSR